MIMFIDKLVICLISTKIKIYTYIDITYLFEIKPTKYKISHLYYHIKDRTRD